MSASGVEEEHGEAQLSLDLAYLDPDRKHLVVSVAVQRVAAFLGVVVVETLGSVAAKVAFEGFEGVAVAKVGEGFEEVAVVVTMVGED